MQTQQESRPPFWMEQCLAARYYLRPKLGTEVALRYLIGEKLVSFIDSLSRQPGWSADLPAFVAEIRRGFRQRQIQAYFDKDLKGRSGSRARRANLKKAKQLLLAVTWSLNPTSMITDIITRKSMSVYVAYAPEFDMSACGKCWEEAVNSLTDEIESLGTARLTGEERKSQP